MKSKGDEMMEITKEHIDGKAAEWLVDYGAKVKARYRIPFEEEITDDQDALLGELQRFVFDEVQVKTLENMSEVNGYKLVERLSRRFCGLHSTRKEYDIDKSVIRYEILTTIEQIEQYGEPQGYPVLRVKLDELDK